MTALRWALLLGAMSAAVVVALLTFHSPPRDPCARDRELYDLERASLQRQHSWIGLARENLLRCVCPLAYQRATQQPSQANVATVERCADREGIR